MNDLVNAMKNKDKETLAVLRMLKGAIQLEEINNMLVNTGLESQC